MGRFEEALALTFGFEGGVSNDPDDHGKLTNLGITQATWDSYCHLHGLPHSSVVDVNHGTAVEVYRVLFWDESHAGFLDSPAAECHFDCAVNSGPSRAIKLLQKAVGVAPDGDFGAHTQAAVKRHSGVNLALGLLNQREAFFHAIGVGSQAKFLRGWLRRVETLRAYVRKHQG